ncbi:MAG: NUDIX hydrolase [Clostridia bacterium]|nr:NUDIX hydrolase [Clostridia bacterium]
MPQNHENTDWSHSVTAVVQKDGCVLLARHTYGGGKGKYIVPGGYLEHGETPEEAVKREYFEETGIVIEPRRVIALRCNAHDWYLAFSADYVSGEPTSDGDENDDVAWMNTDEALSRDDVPDTTKKLILCARNAASGFERLPYNGNPKNGWGVLYGVEIE